MKFILLVIMGLNLTSFAQSQTDPIVEECNEVNDQATRLLMDKKNREEKIESIYEQKVEMVDVLWKAQGQLLLYIKRHLEKSLYKSGEENVEFVYNYVKEKERRDEIIKKYASDKSNSSGLDQYGLRSSFSYLDDGEDDIESRLSSEARKVLAAEYVSLIRGDISEHYQLKVKEDHFGFDKSLHAQLYEANDLRERKPEPLELNLLSSGSFYPSTISFDDHFEIEVCRNFILPAENSREEVLCRKAVLFAEDEPLKQAKITKEEVLMLLRLQEDFTVSHHYPELHQLKRDIRDVEIKLENIAGKKAFCSVYNPNFEYESVIIPYAPSSDVASLNPVSSRPQRELFSKDEIKECEEKIEQMNELVQNATDEIEDPDYQLKVRMNALYENSLELLKEATKLIQIDKQSVNQLLSEYLTRNGDDYFRDYETNEILEDILKRDFPELLKLAKKRTYYECSIGRESYDYHGEPGNLIYFSRGITGEAISREHYFSNVCPSSDLVQFWGSESGSKPKETIAMDLIFAKNTAILRVKTLLSIEYVAVASMITYDLIEGKVLAGENFESAIRHPWFEEQGIVQYLEGRIEDLKRSILKKLDYSGVCELYYGEKYK